MTLDKRTALQAWNRIDSGAALFRLINRLSMRMTYLLSTLMLSAVCAADYFTGIELMMSPMYAFPCLLMDWRIGRTPALLYAVAASYVQWLVGTFGGRTYTNPDYLYWDILLNVIFYGALIWVVSKLRLALEMERMLSRVDFLTRLANRETFYEVLKLEVKRSRRYGRSLAIVSVDCNRFKDFNKARGHSTGDLLLQAIADVMVRKFRDTDTVTRTGDDEFMVILPETGLPHMESLMHSLQAQIDTLMQLRGWSMTCSYACSVYDRPPSDIEQIMQQQSRLMAMAKRQPVGSLVPHVWPLDETPVGASSFMEYT